MSYKIQERCEEIGKLKTENAELLDALKLAREVIDAEPELPDLIYCLEKIDGALHKARDHERQDEAGNCTS